MQTSRKYERVMVALMFLTWGTVFLDRMAQLYLAPFFAPELKISPEQVGILASGLALTWALSSFVFGAVSDRFGRRPVLIPMVFAFSILSWLSGVARNFQQMFVMRAALGIAEGPCWSVMNALVEESSHPSRRGRNIGIVTSAAAAIGLALAPILTTQVAARYGWRTAFFVAGVPGLVVGVLIWMFIREPQRQGEAVERVPRRSCLSLGEIMKLLRYRNLWVAAAANAGFVTWLILQNAFGPLYITEVAHQPPTTAGFLLGAAGVGSFVVGMIFPMLSDKIGRRPMLMISGAMSIFLPLAIWYLPLYQHLGLLALILALTHGGQAMAALAMVLVPTESVPREMSASAIGFSTLVGEIVGAVLAPAIAGTLAKSYGLQIPLFMAAGGAAFVLVASLFIRETLKREQSVGDLRTPIAAH